MSKKQSNARLMAKDLIAGCFGGIGIVAVGHPFDTLKVNILKLAPAGYRVVSFIPHDSRPRIPLILCTRT